MTTRAVPVNKAAVTPPSRKRTRAKDIPPDKVGKGGNPALLTAALADRLIGTVVTGVPLDVAIAYVGIHRETLRRWRKRGDVALELKASVRNPTERRYADFVLRLDKAMAETTVLAQAGMRQFMLPSREGHEMSDTDKRLRLDAIKFYLGRREHRHYGSTVQTELSGPNGGPILSADMSGEEAWEALIEILGEPNGVEDE
jgi:hypothetical protein